MALSRREKNSATYSIDLKSKLLIAMGSLYWQSTESSKGRRKERGRAGSEARRTAVHTLIQTLPRPRSRDVGKVPVGM